MVEAHETGTKPVEIGQSGSNQVDTLRRRDSKKERLLKVRPLRGTKICSRCEHSYEHDGHAWCELKSCTHRVPKAVRHTFRPKTPRTNAQVKDTNEWTDELRLDMMRMIINDSPGATYAGAENVISFLRLVGI